MVSFTGGALKVVYLVVSYSPVRGSAKDTRLRLHLDRQAIMVQTADGSPEDGASRNGDDTSNPMWAHIMRLLDDEEQAAMVFQIFKQAMVTRAIETDLSVEDRASRSTVSTARARSSKDVRGAASCGHL